MDEKIEVTARPTQKVKLTNWVENVPVRGADGEIIGRASVSDKGEIKASLDVSLMASRTYEMLSFGMADGLSIEPCVKPAVPKYSDTIKRHYQKEANEAEQA